MSSSGSGSRSHRRRAPYTPRFNWDTVMELELISLLHAEWANGSNLAKGFINTVLKKVGRAMDDIFKNGVRFFTLDKIKNKIKNYKVVYQLHEQCLGYSGSAWNEMTETLQISDEWRAAMIAQDPYNDQIITRGCPGFQKCREIWMHSSATGEGAVSSGGDMSVDTSSGAGGSTARGLSPLAFVHSWAREYAGASGSRLPTVSDERAARMRGYEQFEKFMSKQPRREERKAAEIRACIDEVELMDCTDMQKMLGGVALGDDNFRAIFMRWSEERKLLWLGSLSR